LEAGHDLGEESITDYLILDLKRWHPDQVTIFRFNRYQEGKTTGADWEWWFTGKGKWFGMRVQAKKLDSRTLTYKSLPHRLKNSQRKQVNLLINDAKKRGLYPLYCFYNYWNNRSADPTWRCGTFAPRRELWGCTISDAVSVRRKINSNAIGLSDIGPVSMPLMCLVCCNGFFGPGASLPQKVRGIAQQLSGRNQGIAELRVNPPDYVYRIIEREKSLSSDFPEFPISIDGILIIKDALS